MDLESLLLPTESLAALNEPQGDRLLNQMILRNRQIRRILEGIRDGNLEAGEFEVLNDLLAEHEIDPFDFHQNALEIINWVQSNNDKPDPQLSRR